MSLEDNYEVLEQIGEGSFGIVLYAKKLDTSKPVALKVLPVSEETLSDVYSEAQTLEKLSQPECHPNILYYYDCFIDKYKGESSFFISIQLFRANSLTEFMNEQDYIKFNETTLHKILGRLIEGCKYIHSKRYAHCDIKPDNILISSRDLSILYIDFGSACNENSCVYKRQGTFSYAAPEIFQLTAEFTLEGAQARDIWALGLIFFQLCVPRAEVFPYEYAVPAATKRKNIANAPDFDRYPLPEGDIYRINSLIKTMLTNNWKLRPTIFEIESLYKM